MARVRFEATRSAFEESEEVLVCGVSDGEDTYLMFQRSPEGVHDDGVYLEHKDQINGGYGCIGRCSLDRMQLSVDLSAQLGALRDVQGFDVRLRIQDSEYAALRAGLERIFRAYEDLLTFG